MTNFAPKPIAIVMVGIPGCGKSTITKQLIQGIKKTDGAHSVFVYSLDSIIEPIANEMSMTYSDAFDEYVESAKKMCDLGLERSIEAGNPIVIDLTNVTKQHRKEWIERLSPTHRVSAVQLVFVPALHSEAWTKRLDNRENKFIPHSVMSRMLSQFEPVDDSEGFYEVLRVNTFEGKTDDS